MRKNVKRNLRDIVGGLGGAWVVFYVAIDLDPHLLQTFSAVGISPAALAALLAADAALVLGIFAGLTAAAIFLSKAALLRIRRYMGRSA